MVKDDEWKGSCNSENNIATLNFILRMDGCMLHHLSQLLVRQKVSVQVTSQLQLPHQVCILFSSVDVLCATLHACTCILVINPALSTLSRFICPPSAQREGKVQSGHLYQYSVLQAFSSRRRWEWGG